jgi:hypothetical protein
MPWWLRRRVVEEGRGGGQEEEEEDIRKGQAGVRNTWVHAQTYNGLSLGSGSPSSEVVWGWALQEGGDDPQQREHTAQRYRTALHNQKP